VRTRYISLDAAQPRLDARRHLSRPPSRPTRLMAGGSIAEVIASKASGLAPGDLVFGDTGWQDYAALPAKHLTKMPRMEPMTHLLSVLRHRRPHRLFWPPAGRQAQGRRDCRLCRLPPDRSGRSSDRSRRSRAATSSASPAARTNATGSPANSASTPRFDYKDARPSSATGGRPQGHRRLFRQCRRRHSRSLPFADEQPRPHRLLRRDLAI